MKVVDADGDIQREGELLPSARGGQPPPAATSSNPIRGERGLWERAVLVTVGLFSVGLGLAGIFLPLLPATPFFLLAGWCFARGSRRFERWLQNRKWYQDYAARFADGRGIPPHVKVITVLVLWAGIGVSALFVVPGLLPRCGLVVVGVIVTIHILTIRPKMKRHPGREEGGYEGEGA